MYAQLKTFSLLAIAGTAVAAPQGWNNWGQGKWWGGNHGSDATATATDVAVVTAYTTVFYGGAQPTAEATQAPAATPSVEADNSFTKPTTTAALATTTPTAATTAIASSGSSDGYMSVVSEWRSKMGLSALTEDSTLVANALKTVTDGDGKMVHELNSGSMAQVLAPGSSDDFESVFVGGWLCEIPTLSGLDGICSTESAGWDYEGQTGHAEILSSGSYSKIGCALAVGIWGCDLA